MKKDTFSLKSAYSCERKKDYVTILGILLFIFVIVFELYLVLWVPIQLKSRGLLEKEVAKQEMISLADSLRGSLHKINAKDRIQEGEIAIATAVLDNLAVYIRENQDFLNREQIRDLTKTLESYEALAQNWSEGKFLIKEERLDYSNYMKSLKAKAGLEQSSDERKPLAN